MNQLPLIERAIGNGDRIAVREGSQRHTYANVVTQSEAMAAALLQNQNDLEESRIAFLLPAGFDYLVAQWGIWRAGGVAVPLSLSATEKEWEYTLTDSQASMVVTNEDFLPKVLKLCQQHHLELLSVSDHQIPTRIQLPKINPVRRAMILYTSGTTSQPKGVVTTHACIQAQITSLIEAWQWQPDDCIPLFLPLHHIHGIINILSCALWAGASLEAFPRFDLETIFRQVANGAYSVFMAVPTIYVKLIAALESLPKNQREQVIAGFAKMRLMISGSAALPASVHNSWTELTGQQLLERYGMTEIGMALSNPYSGERRPGAVGQPLPGVEIRLQSELGELLTDENVLGEIQVRGPNVFLEYWNRPDATQESFQDDWFCTGDMAVFEDGYYRILGRNSVDIIKSGGYKLSALEIEAALLDHPAIRECAVVGIPDETWGEIVAAAIVLQEDQTLEAEDLKSWCKDKISPYKIPRRLFVVSELPRNAMGKVTKPTVLELLS